MPGIGFTRVGEDRRHAGMRHVSFQPDSRTAEELSRTVSKRECDRYLPDARRLRRNFMRKIEINPSGWVSATRRQRETNTQNRD